MDINPLQILPSDLHGPVSTAHRVADTFAHVYMRMSVPQHAVVCRAALDVIAEVDITLDSPGDWIAGRFVGNGFSESRDHIGWVFFEPFASHAQAANPVRGLEDGSLDLQKRRSRPVLFWSAMTAHLLWLQSWWAEYSETTKLFPYGSVHGDPR